MQSWIKVLISTEQIKLQNIQYQLKIIVSFQICVFLKIVIFKNNSCKKVVGYRVFLQKINSIFQNVEARLGGMKIFKDFACSAEKQFSIFLNMVSYVFLHCLLFLFFIFVFLSLCFCCTKSPPPLRIIYELKDARSHFIMTFSENAFLNFNIRFKSIIHEYI